VSAAVTDPDRYDLLLSPGARRAQTDLLPPAVTFACWEFINGPLRDNPRIVGTPLREPFAGLWRAHRGEYRVRYDIEEEQHLLRVLDIDHRRDAYRA
jgi:mRNA interferase RelE/StbE